MNYELGEAPATARQAGQKYPHAGVILFRLEETDLATKIARLDEVLSNYADRLDQFLVVTARRVRVRQTG